MLRVFEMSNNEKETTRSEFLIGAIICFGIAFFLFGLWATIDIYFSYSIAHGKHAIARVTAYVPQVVKRKSDARVVEYHTLEFDGLRERIDLYRRYPLGSNVSILYDSDAPSNAAPAAKGASTFDILRGEGRYTVVVFNFTLFGIGVLFSILMIVAAFLPSHKRSA